MPQPNAESGLEDPVEGGLVESVCGDVGLS